MRTRFLLALLTLLTPALSNAVALGPMEVTSKLNQRLNATIEVVTRDAGELEEARVTLADQAAFDRAGIERSFVLTKLRFEVVADAQGSYIQVSSKESIREPQLNFIVELDSPSGRLQREYTLLLKPAVSSLDRY